MIDNSSYLIYTREKYQKIKEFLELGIYYYDFKNAGGNNGRWYYENIYDSKQILNLITCIDDEKKINAFRIFHGDRFATICDHLEDLLENIEVFIKKLNTKSFFNST